MEDLKKDASQEYSGLNQQNRRLTLLKLLSLTKTKFFFLLVITLSVPLTVLALQKTQTIKQNASSSLNYNTTGNKDLNGYIVILKDSVDVAGSRLNVNQVTLRADRESFKTIAAKLLNKSEVKRGSKDNLRSSALHSQSLNILNEYSYAFNGLALDISDSEANLLKNLPQVAGIYKNLTIQATLFNSVPLIGADKIWEYKDASGKNIDGTGVNIGVVDTGVDYTHSGLGASKISERNFITPANFDYDKAIKNREYYGLTDQVFALSSKFLVYISGIDQVTRYNFANKNKIVISLKTPGLDSPLLYKVQVTNTDLVYFAADKKNAGLFVYNFASKKIKKINNLKPNKGNFSILTDFAIDDNTLIYFDPTTISNGGMNLKTYNLKSGKDSLLGKFTEANYAGYFASNRNREIAYSVSSVRQEWCQVSKIYIQNIDTGEKRIVKSPHMGNLQDYKNNKLLYQSTCDDQKNNPGSFYLYDLNTKKETFISQNQYIDPNENKFGILSRLWVDSRDRYTAKIGLNAVFFSGNLDKKIYAYNFSSNKYEKMSIFTNGEIIETLGNRFCFSDSNSSKFKISCMVYDPNDNYSLPYAYNSKVIGGYNFIYDNNDALDDQGHGTHVANIVAGNGVLKGVAPGANIISYKVLDSDGFGTEDEVISVIDLVIAARLDSDPTNDIDILSMSFGADCEGKYTADCGPDDPQSKALNRAADVGIISIVAAGNSGPRPGTIWSPGVAKKAFTVGAVDNNLKIANFSSRGPINWNNEIIHKPDLVAPGVNICSAKAKVSSGAICNKQYKEYTALSGTSMATPHISGVASLLKQVYPTLTIDELKNKLIGLTKDLSYSQDTQGSGIIDLSLWTEIKDLPIANQSSN